MELRHPFTLPVPADEASKRAAAGFAGAVGLAFLLSYLRRRRGRHRLARARR